MNYYQHHIGDYEAATAHLTWIEDAAYTRLLRLYYRTERPLPLDSAALYRLVRAASKHERAAVDTVLAEFFERRDDGWHQTRCDAEIAAMHARAERNREVGRRGGRPRRNPSDEDGAPRVPETQTVSANNPDGLCSDGARVRSGFTKKTLPTSNLQDPRSKPPVSTPGLSSFGSSHSDSNGKALRVPASSEKSAAPAANGHDHGPPSAPKTAATWAAYASAYVERWHVEPVRNRKTNALLAQLVDRVGATEAPHVAAWYVTSNNALYVRSKHCPDLLVRDCEGLRTEWATQTRMTTTEARQADEHQAAYEAVRWVHAHLAATAEEAADGPHH